MNIQNKTIKIQCFNDANSQHYFLYLPVNIVRKLNLSKGKDAYYIFLEDKYFVCAFSKEDIQDVIHNIESE